MKKFYVKKWALCLCLIGMQVYMFASVSQLNVNNKSLSKGLLLQQNQIDVVTPLKRVLQDLAEKHNVVFHYNSPIVKDKFVRNISIEDFSKTILSIESQTNLTFEKINAGNYMVLDTPKRLDNSNINIPAAIVQDKKEEKVGFKITGTVTDAESSDKLIGVSVSIKDNPAIGDVTNENGQFTIELPGEKGIGTLVFSYIGYVTQEVQIENRSSFEVKMKSDVEKLQEVVVVGYGERKRDELSGAVTSISSEMITLQPVTSIDQALQGMVSGVTLREGSGAPGSGPEILIRGINTFQDNKPLIVIDNVIFESGNDQNNNPLALLNPEDVENIVVLKDAASKAIYGSRATAGVILVTTKRGKLGKPKITFNSNMGISNILPFEKPDVLNATELAQFYKEANIDRIRATNPLYSEPNVPVPDDLIPAQFRNPSQYGVGTNWFDAITRRGVNQNHNISVNGGTENIKYFVSANYSNNESVLLNNDLARFSFRSNIDVRISQKLRFGLNLAPSRTEANRSADEPSSGQFSAGSTFTSTFWADPSAPLYSSPGFLSYTTKGSITSNWTANPLYQLTIEEEKRRGSQLASGGYLEFEPIKNLTLKTNFSYNYNYSRSRNFQPSNLLTGDGLTGILPNVTGAKAVLFNSAASNFTSDNIAQYRFKVKKHSFDIMAGFNLNDVSTESSSTTAIRLIDENFKLPDYNNVDKTVIGNYVGSEEYGQGRLLSAISRLNYNFSNKYFVNFSVRRDGSSRFGRDVQYGTFPAGSFTWRASNEAFLAKWKKTWLSDLRFEVGYGLTGNNTGIGSYTHLGNIALTNNYAFGGVSVPGSAVGSLPNSSITWEESKQFDAGLNLSVFNDRIKLAMNVYQQITGGLLAQIPLSWVTGFGNVYGNQNSRIRNRGFEVQVDAVPVRNKKFQWQTGFNVSKYNNLILEYFDSKGFLTANAGNGTQVTISAPGQPIGMYRGLKTLGLFTAAEIADPAVPKYDGARVGSLKYLDGNGNGRLEIEADYVILGNPHPDLMFGWNNNMTYGQFSLRTIFAGQLGGLIYDLRREINWNVDGNFNIDRQMLDRWRPGDDPATKSFPTTVSTSGSITRYVRFPSDNKIYDGSYVSLKNVTLSYNLGKILKTKTQLFSGAEVYGSLRNVFYLSAYKYGNPEVRRTREGSAGRSINYGSFPISRTAVFGLNVSF
jgi:TonB-dependent starch-binding outer membrane protein SusC